MTRTALFVQVRADTAEWLTAHIAPSHWIGPTNSTWQDQYVRIDDSVTQAEYVLRWGADATFCIGGE